jgi:hypothetical protein
LEQQDGLLNEHKALIDDFFAGQTGEDDGTEGEQDEESSEWPPEEQNNLKVQRVAGGGRSSLEAWQGDDCQSRAALATSFKQSLDPAATGSVQSSGRAGSSSDRPGFQENVGPSLMKIDGLGGVSSQKPLQQAKKTGVLWEKVVELCEQTRFLEAYKQVIAEPEESCLLRLMQHTGPIVERLDAESNSRLIRRLIHILSSPSKEPAATCIDQIFSWLSQALEVGIHFTTSQVEDLAAALQKAAAAQSPLAPMERAEAARLLHRVSALRRS